MAFQVVPDTAQCHFRLIGDPSTQMGGSVAEWSFYVRDELVGWPQASVDNLRDYALAWWSTSADQMTDPDWMLDTIVVKDIGSETGNISIYDPAVKLHGSRAGAAAPPQVAFYYALRGQGGGHPKRGGVFLPFGVEEDIDVNYWLATPVGDFDSALDDWFTGLSGVEASWAAVIVSRYSSTNDDIKDARAALREAIAASKRAEGVTNLIASRGGRSLLGSQRDRRSGITG